MTLYLLLILLSLCALTRSDSSVSHFQYIVTNGPVVGALKDDVNTDQVVHSIKLSNQAKTPHESLFDGSHESCANQCLSTKFFCRSFMFVALNDELQCVMDYERKNNLMDYFIPVSIPDPRVALMIAAFDINQKLDNVAALSSDPILLREDRFGALLNGYGVSKSLNLHGWKELEAILKTCAVALKLEKSKWTHFRHWLNTGGKLTYEQHSMPSLTSKGTQTFESTRKRQKLDYRPDINVLTFLDLFSRAFDQKTETIYDPDKGTLYVNSANLQLLFVSYYKDDYIWAAFGKKASNKYVYFGRSTFGTTPDEEKNVIDDLTNAAARFNREVVNPKPVYYFGRESGLWRLISLLTANAWDFVHGNEELLFHDLSQVVPIIDNNKSPMQFTEQVQNSFPRGHVDIITQRK